VLGHTALATAARSWIIELIPLAGILATTGRQLLRVHVHRERELSMPHPGAE
jgi:hypothetical protein